MKNVLLIGAATGEGSLARALVTAGHRVVVASPWGEGAAAASSCDNLIHIDLADRAAVFGAFKAAIQNLGHVDVLVNATAHDAAVTAEPVDIAESGASFSWRRTITELSNGSFYCTQAALRHMVSRSSGQIVYICADQAADGSLRVPEVCAATCGVLALSSALAGSAFRHGISMNSLIVGAPYGTLEAPPALPETPGAPVLAYASKASYPILRDRQLHTLQEQAGVGWSEAVVGLIDHLGADAGRLIAGATLRVANIGRQAPFIRWTY